MDKLLVVLVKTFSNDELEKSKILNYSSTIITNSSERNINRFIQEFSIERSYILGQKTEHSEFLKKLNELPEFVNYVNDNNEFAHKYRYGDKYWYKGGKLHRADIAKTDQYTEIGATLPAIIYSDGEKHWYKEGKPHRTDIAKTDQYTEIDAILPAVIKSDGSKVWYKEGVKMNADEILPKRFTKEFARPIKKVTIEGNKIVVEFLKN